MFGILSLGGPGMLDLPTAKLLAHSRGGKAVKELNSTYYNMNMGI